MALLEGEWFQILQAFPGEDFRPFAADDYNARYDFNQPSETDSVGSTAARMGHVKMPLDKEQTRQQILFDRRTAPIPKNPPPPVLYPGKRVEPTGAFPPVRAEDIAPAQVFLRLAEGFYWRQPAGVIYIFLSAFFDGWALISIYTMQRKMKR